MKCINCGHAMTTKRENVPYKALPGTVLAGVDVSRCPNCGEFEVAIPAIDELNHVLATHVIKNKTRLNGAEVRFLRSFLGYSGADFAKLIASSPATVSRWESDTQPIGHHTDLLLRSMVAMDKRIDDYSIKSFAEVTDEKPSTAKVQRAFKPAAKSKWSPTELRA